MSISAQLPTYGHRGMAATMDARATYAALRVLEAGGNAMDAAVAAGAVMHISDPGSSGIGGDAFILYYDGATGSVTGFNGSGKIPHQASVAEYRALGYSQMPETGIHSVTVPGAVHCYETALKRCGRMPLSQVLQPAIDLASRPVARSASFGASMTAFLAQAANSPGVSESPFESVAGSGPVGLASCPDLHRTLVQIAHEGAEAFYGDVASRIVEHSDASGGFFAMRDFSEHETHVYEPLSTSYRNATVYQTGLPSQGHIVLEALNIVEGYDLAAMGYGTVDLIHHMVEATKCAFADRLTYMGDPAFGDVPLEAILSKDFAAQRRDTIDPARASKELQPGALQGRGDTTSLVVADGDGNAASFIVSLAGMHGSGVTVPGTGVMLNNRASYFLLDESAPNGLLPSKKPMHTLNTWILCRDGEFLAMGNTPGGDLQPQLNLQAITNLVDFGMDPQQVAEAPNWSIGVWTEPPLLAERPYLLRLGDRLGDVVIGGLDARGHATRRVGYGGVHGRLQIITRDPETGALLGGSRQSVMGIA